MGELRGANVLLTGASGGIGSFIARELASRGANLVLTARHMDGLERQAASLLASGVKVATVPADLGDPVAHDVLATRAEEALGPIDVLVNNAAFAPLSRFSDLDDADLRHMINVNLVAPMMLTRRLLPGMIARGHGHLVTIASLDGKRGSPYDATYSGTKAALISWMEGLHLELEGTGVQTGIVLPGFVSEAGMFVDRCGTAPRLMGASPAADVAQAVVRVIEGGRQEVIVSPGPIRPFLVLCSLSPALGDRMLKLLGVVRVKRWMYEHQRTG